MRGWMITSHENASATNAATRIVARIARGVTIARLPRAARRRSQRANKDAMPSTLGRDAAAQIAAVVTTIIGSTSESTSALKLVVCASQPTPLPVANDSRIVDSDR